jgi:signal transduction histidine kinase
VPVAAVVALATARLVESGQRAADAGLVRELTSLSADISALAHETHEERMAAARLLDRQNANELTAYNAQARRTDETIAAYSAARKEIGDVPAAVETRLARVDDHLATLNGTRQDVISNEQVSISEAVLRYGVVITDMVAYGEVIGQYAGEGELADSLRALAAFGGAKAAMAEQQAVAFAALAGGGQLDEEQFASFVGTLTSQQEGLLAFSLAAAPEQQQFVNSTVTGDAVFLADQASNEISRSVGEPAGISADDASVSIGAVNDLMRFAEAGLERRVLDEAENTRADVVRKVLIESILVLLTLAIAVALAVVLARSLVRSLSRLREGALSVANHDLPEAVAALRDARNLGEGGIEAVTRQVRDPIRLRNKDEVGQVAQAFNVVHREAVRVAAEQAALRTSVSAMFLNLARRSQALVDRMIGELDNIERTEEDPKRLAQLFQLDHLATRMRRNDENLLVLAGADSAAPRREDALLIDAVRAAQSEVELYNRIEFGTVDSDISIAAHAVNDVVRLLAELLDNATRFSPPNTIVVAEARRIRDYVLIQVEDRGLGISDEQLDSLNRRLAEPPAVDVDVAAFRLMGLAVVARLAARYGIRVELRHNSEGGTVAHVSLPSGILILPQYRGREPLSMPPPRMPRAVEPGQYLGNGNGGWAEAAKPALPARSAAATLTEPWDHQPRWDAPSESSPLADQVTAAHPVMPRASAAGYGAPHAGAAPAAVRPEEMPIFREMEASWFRAHNTTNLEPWAMPTAGHPPPPVPPTAPGVGDSHPDSSGPNGYGPWAAAGAPTPSAGRPPAAPASPSPAAAMSPPMGSSASTPRVPHTSAPPSAAPPRAAPPPPAAAPVSPASRRTGFGGGGNGPAGSGFGGFSGFGGGGSANDADPTGAGVPRPSAPPVPPYEQPAPEAGSRPRSPGDREQTWQTKADEGWRLASEAAAPVAAGTTRSGLPKRVPQAQLVPGGVEQISARDRARRTPEEVRGLLSAYHRGVQRGRLAGDDGETDRPQSKENR